MSRFISSFPSAKQLSLLLLAAVVFFVLWRGGKSIDATWILAGVAGFVVLCSYAVERREQHQSIFLVSRFVYLSALGLIAWTIVSFLFSQTQNYGLDEVMQTTSLLLLFLFVSRDRYRESFAEKFLFVLAVSALLACAIGIGIYWLQPVTRFVGTFFDVRFHTDYWPNAWAEFLLLAWPAVLFFVIRSERPRQKYLWLAGLSFLFACFALSYSRGALLACVGQIVLLAIAYVRLNRVALRSLMIGTLSVLAVTSVIFIGANGVRSLHFAIESTTEKVTFSADEGTSSISERSSFFRQALTLASEHPLVGWGPYSFRFAQPRLQTEVLATSDHPHNVFLKLAAERGIPAAIFFFLFLLGILLPHVRTIFSRPETPTLHAERLLVVGVLGVLAHNLIDYNLQFVGIALPLALSLGILVRRSPAQPQRQSRRKVLEVYLACVLLIVAFIEGRGLVLSSLGRHDDAKGNTQAALQWYEAADGEIFSRDLELSRAQLLQKTGRREEAMLVIESYQERNAIDARAWKMLAEAATGSAVKMYAERAYVYGGRNDLGTARLLVDAVKNDPDALRVWKPSLDELLESFAVAIERNLHFAALSLNVEEFLTLARTMSILYPEDEARYDILSATVDRNARKERERFQSRDPGMLW